MTLPNIPNLLALDPDPNLFALLAAFVGGAFALLRLVFAGHRKTVDRFVTFLQGALARQEAANAALRISLDGLADTLREQTRLLSRLRVAPEEPA